MKLIDVVKAYPDKPWNIPSLRRKNHLISIDDDLKCFDDPYYLNLSVTWEFVCSHPDVKWVYDVLSYNPNITMDIIENNPSQPWDMRYIVLNPNITTAYIEKNINMICSYSYHLSINPNLEWKVVEKNLSFNWDWFGISEHCNIPIQALYKYTDLFKWTFITINKNFTWHVITKNPKLPWVYDKIVDNDSISCQIVCSKLTLKSAIEDYARLINVVKKYDVTWEMIKKRLDREINDELTMIMVIARPRTLWYAISANPNITPKIIHDNINLPWDFEELSKNNMSYPYFNDKKRRDLAIKTAAIIYDQLIICACHPRRHPGNWMTQDELKDHPLALMSSSNVTAMYDNQFKTNKIQ